MYFTDLEDQRERNLKYVEYDQFLEAKSLLILLPPILHHLRIQHPLSEGKCVLKIL